VFEGFRTAGNIIRPLHVYDNNRSRAAATGRLYGGFVRRRNQVFDVGDRAAVRWLAGRPHAANSGDIYATLA
jgi:hypothetical protein